MPYRIDIATCDADALLRLLDLGALDAERRDDGRGAAIVPDHVMPGEVATALGTTAFTVSAAIGRDADSVWVLGLRAVQLGRIRLVPAGATDPPHQAGDIRLLDTPAFGTGLHATTALCMAMIDELVEVSPVQTMLDFGTGSGVLALAALTLGVPRVVGIDIEGGAVRAARDNARENGLAARLDLVQGGLEVIVGRWPLVVANVLAAPLIELAQALAGRVGHHGHLILSGIHASLEADVARAYTRVGMRPVDTRTRDGWTALSFRASW